LIRSIAVIIATGLLLALQGVLHKMPGLHVDVAALVIAYLVLERPVITGAATALVVGYLQDLGSGGPTGLHAAASVMAFLVGRVAVAKVRASGPVIQGVLGVLATWLTIGFALAIDAFLGPGTSHVRAMMPALPTIALTSIVLCYPVHRLLARIDEKLGHGEEEFVLR